MNKTTGLSSKTLWALNATSPEGEEYTVQAECFPSCVVKFCADTGLEKLSTHLEAAVMTLQHEAEKDSKES